MQMSFSSGQTVEAVYVTKYNLEHVRTNWTNMFTPKYSPMLLHTRHKKASNYHANLPLEMYSFTL